MQIGKPWIKALKIAGIVLGVLVILQVIATFFLGPVLASQLKDQIEEASFGVYKMSNRSANLNLLNGSLIIKDFEVTTDTARQSELGQVENAAYQVKAPRISMSGMEVYDAFRSKKLDISALEIDQPEIEFNASANANTNDTSFEATLYELTNGRLTNLNIGNLEVREGTFKYFPQDEGDTFEATDIFLRIKNFQLDSATNVFSDRSFFAEEIEIGADVRDYHIVTEDSLYELAVGKIGVATHRSEFLAGEVLIKPILANWSQGNTQQEASPFIAAIKLPRLRLEGIDLHELYFKRNVALDAFRLIEPELVVVKTEEQVNLFESKKPLGLLGLEKEIMPYLKGFRIEEVEVIDGSIRQLESWTDSSQFASIEGLNGGLRNFTLDPESRNKLLRSDDIRLEIEKYDLEIIPETYRISGNNLWLSTQNRFLLTDSLKLIPGPRAYEVAQKGDAGPPDVYQLSLPSLVIEGVDASEAYFERRLEVNKIYLGGPQIRLTNYPQVEREQVSALAESDFYDLISAELNSLVINDLEVDEGQFFFNADNEANRNAFSVKDIGVQVTNFRVDSTTRQRANLPFYADDINVSIDVEGYSLVLPDSNHQVTIGEIGVSTKDSIIFASAIRFSPTTQAYSQPDSLKKNLYDLYVPRFELQGLNVLELYLDKALHVDGVQLQEPLLRMHAYSGEDQEEMEIDFQDAYSLIAPNLNALSVGRLSIEGGTFHHTRHLGKQLTDFSIPDVWMMLESFSLDSTTRMGPDNFLFAEAIEARIRGFYKPLKDSVHNLSIGEIGLSSSSQEVYMDGVQLLPVADSSLWKNVPSLYQAFVPQVRIQGLDPYKLYRYRDLRVDSILLQDPSFQLANYPDVDKEKLDSLANADLYDVISGYLRSLEVGRLRVADGSFRLKDERFVSGKDFEVDQIAVQINNFRLDSLAQEQKNNPFYAEDIAINLDIDQYELMLPDSSYKIQAGKIGFLSGGSNIFIDSLNILPVQAEGQAIELSMPQLQLEGVDLLDVYLNREVELAALRMISPQMSLRNAMGEMKHISKGSEMAKMLNPDIYGTIEPYFNFVNIASVEVYNGWAGWRMQSGKPFVLPDVNLQLEDFRLDPMSHQRLWHYALAKDFNLKINNFRHALNDMYDFRMGSINLSSCDDSIAIDSLQLIPRFGRYEFGERLGYSTDRVDMCMNRVVFKGLDLWPLLVDQKIAAKALYLKGMSFDVFRDRRHPDTMQIQKILPQEWLRKFPAYVHIDTVHIEDTKATYGEHIEEAKKPGFFHVRDINSKFFPVTNDSVLLANNIIAKIEARATLMDKGKLRVNFDVPIADTLNSYSFAGVLSPWDLKELNIITESAAFVQIRSGNLQKLLFNVSSNKYEAKGRMRCYYSDLRISVLNRKNGSLKNVQSFFANSIGVRPNNPTKRFLRIGRIYTEHNPNRSIFNHWFKSVLSGVSSSVSIKGKRDRIRDFLKNFETD